MTRLPHLPRHTRDQLTAWLPVLLMGFFALGSWWLIRSAPRFDAASAKRPLSHDPDYGMRDFTVRNFDANGRFTSMVAGTQAWHFPDTDLLEIEAPRMRSRNEEGRVTIASAKRAVSNPDGTEVQLYGDADVVRQASKRADGQETPQLEYRSSYLKALPKQGQYSSDQPVELLRGADRFTADTLVYDDKTGIADLKGNVRGVIQPTLRTHKARP